MNNIKLYISGFYNYISLILILSSLGVLLSTNILLFHFLAEFVTITLSMMIFIFYWSGVNTIDSIMIRLIGIGFLFIAFLNIGHTLQYSDIGIGYSYNPAISILPGITARLMLSITILLAVTLEKTIKPLLILLTYSFFTGLIFLAIFIFIRFQVFFVQNINLLTLKIFSEYLIILLLVLSIFFLIKNRKKYDIHTVILLVLFIFFSLLSTLFIIISDSFQTPLKVFAVFFKVIAYFLLYKAVFIRSIIEPQKILYKELNQYLIAIESAPTNVIITDIDGVIVYINPKFTEVTGFTKDEALGKKMNIVNPGVQDNQYYKELWETILSGREWRGEFCNKKKNGEIFWEKASISSIKDDNNKIIRFIGFQEDITQDKAIKDKDKSRLQQQLKYRTVLLQLSKLILTDMETEFKIITESISKTLEVGRASIWLSINNNEALKCADLYTNKTHENGEIIYKSDFPAYFETLLLKKMNINNDALKTVANRKYIDEYLIPMGITSIIDAPIITEGELEGVVHLEHQGEKRVWTIEEQGFVTSIASIISVLIETYKKVQMEKRLVIAVEEAKRANRVKSEFLANMSHEIRTPMNAILGFSQILVGRIKDEEELSYIESINSSGKHLLALINDILDLSKVEAGKTDIIYAPCNFSDLILSLKKMFIHKLKETQVQLNIDLDKDIPATLQIDEERLKQVLINIVGNAVKFTKYGSITISSYFTYTDKSKESISLTIDIDDTGIGIPEKEWENVFNPFDQTKEGAKSEYSGTGLGLAISRKLINLMDGNIYIVEKNNPGTLFRINLNNIIIAESSTKKDDKPLLKPYITQSDTINGFKEETLISENEVTELLNILKKNSSVTCNTLIKKLSMQKAKLFANDIQKLGNDYNITIVSNWAKLLLKAVNSFKKDDIIEILNTFPDLIKKIQGI